MLVLTRHLDTGSPDKATITIGHDIEVTLVEVHGGQVRIGVSAPRSKAVHRKEVYLQIQQDKARTDGQEDRE